MRVFEMLLVIIVFVLRDAILMTRFYPNIRNLG